MLVLANEAEQGARDGEGKAVDLMRQAERLSRRDLLTQLWLVNYHLRHNEIRQVMQHFDIGLRTTASGRDSLFPLLATAAIDRRIADPLIQRMREKPAWALPFAAYLLNDQVMPQTAAYVIESTMDPAIPEEFEVIRNLLEHLAARGEHETVWQLYTRFGFADGSTKQAVADGGFEGTRSISPFAWALTQAADLWAAREADPNGSGSVLRIAASGQSGVAARQFLKLSSGRYRLSAEFGDVPLDAFERPAIEVACADKDRQVTVSSIKPAFSGPDSIHAQANFTVPTSCQFQWLSIRLTGRENRSAVGPWIDDVAITRLHR